MKYYRQVIVIIVKVYFIKFCVSMRMGTDIKTSIYELLTLKCVPINIEMNHLEGSLTMRVRKQAC